MIVLHVEGMTCGHCVQHVEQALAAVAAVEAVQVQLAAAEARVEGRPDPQALVRAVEAAGYTARVLQPQGS